MNGRGQEVAPLESCIVVWGDTVHLFLDRIADCQSLNEVVDGLLGDGGVRSGQLLECFVRLGLTFTAKDRL